jgi:membrane protein implicated in regulation of membrane protease activity
MTRIFRGESHRDQDLGDGENPQGEIVTAVTPIEPNQKGRIRYRGTDWYAVAEQDIEKGDRVEILGYEKNSKQIFRVKKAQTPHEEKIDS